LSSVDFGAVFAKHGLLIAFGVFFLVLVSLVFMFVSSVFTFVFVDSLLNKKPRVVAALGENKQNAVSLFLFRVLVCLFSILTLLPGVFIVFNSFSGGVVDFAGLFGGVLFFVFWAFTFGLLVSLVVSFIHSFVVPFMLLNGCGFRVACKRVFGLVRGEWRQFVVFLFVSFVLSFVVGIVFFVFLFFVGIVFLLGLFSLMFLGPLAAIFLLLAFFLFVFFLLVVGLPFSVFWYYFAFVFYGKTDASFGGLLRERGVLVEE
jgi:hypothetical protein